ncbi:MULTISPECIES: hypothetical protein [Sporosarcina]|uniref:hypothetical protein n=1 Tax=Sporosarcina TaxID=1569 RepID=UPI0002EEFFDF|nr:MULTISPECIES: hypothetical protein [Sporosarcina]MBY0221108.1 hypothetical protein [Sporosarcina aquimarina]
MPANHQTAAKQKAQSFTTELPIFKKKYQDDIQRLENQVGQLIRIIANLNERLNYLETTQSNPFFLSPDRK